MEHEFVALGHAGSDAYAGLETFPNPGVERVELVSDELTAVCPITNQPDFYTATIEYRPRELCLESKSLKIYLSRFHDQGVFCEALAVQIRDEVAAALELDAKDVHVSLRQKAARRHHDHRVRVVSAGSILASSARDRRVLLRDALVAGRELDGQCLEAFPQRHLDDRTSSASAALRAFVSAFLRPPSVTRRSSHCSLITPASPTRVMNPSSTRTSPSLPPLSRCTSSAWLELLSRDQPALDDDVAEPSFRRRFHCSPDIGAPVCRGIPRSVGLGMRSG